MHHGPADLLDVSVTRLRGAQASLGPDHSRLGMLAQLGGHSRFRSAGGLTVAGRGAIVGFDPAQLTGREHDAASAALLVHAPRGALPVLDDALRASGGVFRAANSDLLPIVVPFARHFANHYTGLDRGLAAQQLLRGAARMLAAALLADPPATAAPERGDANTEALTAVTSYIDEHLGSEHLTPAVIAAATFMSVRALHARFSATGTTVGAWIRDRRLDACRLDLADDGCAQRTIAEIALARGMRDPAHFSRLFVRRFGVTPSAYRAACGGAQGQAAGPVG